MSLLIRTLHLSLLLNASWLKLEANPNPLLHQLLLVLDRKVNNLRPQLPLAEATKLSNLLVRDPRFDNPQFQVVEHTQLVGVTLLRALDILVLTPWMRKWRTFGVIERMRVRDVVDSIGLFCLEFL